MFKLRNHQHLHNRHQNTMPFWDIFRSSGSSRGGNSSNGGQSPRGPRRRSTRDSDITRDSVSDMTSIYGEDAQNDYIDRVRHSWGVYNEGQRSARAVWNNNPDLQTKEHWNRLDRLRRGATDYATDNRISYGDAWRQLNDRAEQVERSYIREHQRRQEEQRQRERERFQNRRGLTSLLFGRNNDPDRGRSRSPTRPVRRSTTRTRRDSPTPRRHPGSPSPRRTRSVRTHAESPLRRSRTQTSSRTATNRRSTRW